MQTPLTDSTGADRPQPARKWKTVLILTAISLLLLAPCYWQPRIQAGDLSSHIYNSWLARLIESGRAQGLIVAPQTTNVLFDYMLAGLFRVVGAEAAQRLAVGVCALTFIWGAFAFVGAVAGRRPWNLLPCIAMLAYGWVFHMGFFNFYLALALCFWAMALAWHPTRLRIAGAAAMLGLAYFAHALPVVWAQCLLAYYFLARGRTPRQRAWMTMGALALMAVVRVVTAKTLGAQWYPAQLTKIFGADQLWVFDAKYYWLLMGLLFIWGTLFVSLLRQSGPRKVFGSIPFQLFIMSAGGVLILPSAVLLPGFLHSLAYISERMSLGVAICVCAVLGAARPRRFERVAMGVLALVFFSFVYADERKLNVFEDRMSDVVAQLAPGQRVVSVVDAPDLRVNAVTHMIDRACVGRCYSFANYEPSTAQFRVRAVGPNPIVVASYLDSWQLQTGKYSVKSADVPLYAVDMDGNGRMKLRLLEAGKLCGSTSWRVLRSPVPAS